MDIPESLTNPDIRLLTRASQHHDMRERAGATTNSGVLYQQQLI